MPHHLVPNGQIRANVPHETVKTLFPNHFRDVPLESGRLSSIKTIELHNAHNLTFSCNSNMAYAPLSVSGQSFTYDANGNMTRGLEGKSIVYDSGNQPIKVTKGGVTTEHVYGPDGRRTLRIDDAGGTPTNPPAETRAFAIGRGMATVGPPTGTKYA